MMNYFKVQWNILQTQMVSFGSFAKNLEIEFSFIDVTILIYSGIFFVVYCFFIFYFFNFQFL